MPSLIRFLFIVGIVGGIVSGTLYALAVFLEPNQKEITTYVRNVKARP